MPDRLFITSIFQCVVDSTVYLRTIKFGVYGLSNVNLSRLSGYEADEARPLLMFRMSMSERDMQRSALTVLMGDMVVVRREGGNGAGSAAVCTS